MPSADDMTTIPRRAPRIVPKPWGQEEVWLLGSLFTDATAVKFLTIAPRQRLSLQYHKAKAEALILIEGSATLNDEPMHMRMLYAIHPYDVHRLAATGRAGAVLLEVSQGSLADVVRLEDDYNRQ